VVSVTIDQTGLQSTDCSCPYDWGGYCKHIVAVLLAVTQSPDKVDVRASIDDLLSGLREDELYQVLLSLAEHHPGLVDEIEGLIQIQGQLRASKPADVESGPKAVVVPRKRQTPLDPEPFRRQVWRILKSATRYNRYEDYGRIAEIVSNLGEILIQAWKFIESDDGENAILILEAVTEEYLEDWEMLDDHDGEASSFFEELGSAWTEAILTAELTLEERQKWANKFTKWQNEIDDYVPDYGFDVAQAAATQGWNSPQLVRVLKNGEITRKGAWEGEVPWYADDLTIARLNVLERQGRIQEYLYLAEAEGQTELHLTMLAKSGRTAEATESGLKSAATSSEVLALAKALQEQGASESALRIGEHGLTLQGYQKIQLARWLRDAAAVRKPELALRAAEIAFEEECNLADYFAVQSLTGEVWSQYKPRLLKKLKSSNSVSNKIGIYLHEEMISEAIEVADRAAYLGYSDLELVIEAAAPIQPNWAIQQCKKKAESIMDAGKSKYYDNAVEWLRRAKIISLNAGQIIEWAVYLDKILSKHYRKYSLVPKLKTLK
jgi:uncharacterized Zn finger protein